VSRFTGAREPPQHQENWRTGEPAHRRT